METVFRTLTIRQYHINKILWQDRCTVSLGCLSLDQKVAQRLTQKDDCIHEIKLDSVAPHQRERPTDTIMDVIPISTKVLGRLGEGITHTLTGVYVVLCGRDAEGNQMAEFGSSEGTLSEKVMFDRAGTPSATDWLIHMTVVLKPGFLGGRTAPDIIHHIADCFIQDIRDVMKELDGRSADSSHTFTDQVRHGGKKVILIKQVGGQGAMHDNRLFPEEPSGFLGGRSNIDLGNVPVILSPNEYRDGALRAMT